MAFGSYRTARLYAIRNTADELVLMAFPGSLQAAGGERTGSAWTTESTATKWDSQKYHTRLRFARNLGRRPTTTMVWRAVEKLRRDCGLNDGDAARDAVLTLWTYPPSRLAGESAEPGAPVQAIVREAAYHRVSRDQVWRWRLELAQQTGLAEAEIARLRARWAKTRPVNIFVWTLAGTAASVGLLMVRHSLNGSPGWLDTTPGWIPILILAAAVALTAVVVIAIKDHQD